MIITTLEEQAQTIRATITLLEKIVEHFENSHTITDEESRIKLHDCLTQLYIGGTWSEGYNNPPSPYHQHHGLKNLIAALKETNDRLVLSAGKMT